MTYSESVRTVLLKCLVFKGRASRSEFWWFVIFTFLLQMAFSLFVTLFATHDSTPPLWLFIALGVYNLVILLPFISSGVRRLHDSGRGGEWMLIILVPYIGWLWFIVLAATPSQPGDNRFGPMPQ